MELFQEADCVIGVGASLNRYTTEHGYLYPERALRPDRRQAARADGRRQGRRLLRAGRRAAGRRSARRAARAALVHSDRLSHGRSEAAPGQPLRRHAPSFRSKPDRVDPREVCLALDEAAAGRRPARHGQRRQHRLHHHAVQRARSTGAWPGHFFGCIGQMLPAAMGAVVATGNQPTRAGRRRRQH